MAKAPAKLDADHLFALHARSAHPREEPFVLKLLDAPQLAQRILRQGRFVRSGADYWVRSITRRQGTAQVALIFRLKVELAGYPAVEVFFKPRQRGYPDWATEIGVCRLARHLGIFVAPCTERFVPRAVLGAALAALDPALRARIEWETSATGAPGEPRVYGFFRLWAPNYIARLGQYRPTERVLQALAGAVAVGNRARVLASRFHRRFAELLILDYLVYNNDRRHNLGMVRGPTVVLFPIDFGDGLTATPRDKVLCRSLFFRMTLFRRALVERLGALSAQQAVALMRRPGAPPLVARAQVEWMLQQRDEILAHVRWVRKRFGPRVFY